MSIHKLDVAAAAAGVSWHVAEQPRIFKDLNHKSAIRASISGIDESTTSPQIKEENAGDHADKNNEQWSPPLLHIDRTVIR